jgi:putative serine protease PepD
VSLTNATGGAGIGSVSNGSPADRAGLAQGDVVTAIDGKRVSSADDAVTAISSHRPGDELRISFQRGGHGDQVTVKLAGRPS